MPAPAVPSRAQAFYRTMLLGTLIYSVVLGFFNDYTDVLHTSSYSVTFSLAFVLQVLTYLTFAAKDVVQAKFGGRPGRGAKFGLVFGVWLVMFSSKFVFLAVVEVIFREQVQISGFAGIFLVVVVLTVLQKLAELVDRRLGRADPAH
ncbi:MULTISPECIES: hypothetical protein [unclassified Leucobacter]|uniref:hypothetical protein n=1 Tax=unclassified Leucobacter TaxID=2621730 RepID=UPI00165D8133|nr:MULTISPECIES: hypothetical protein [unclassified Leucobacter]MBC9928247.1 hypothetical protein [Leucobacter sp. cx-169]